MTDRDLFGDPLTPDPPPVKLEDMQIERTAMFSPCRTWRYTLRRVWGDGPRMLCVLLNPSTADEHQDDPTNRRVLYWAIRHGYGTLTFCNLFAFRSPYPEVMKAAADPVGPDNDGWITDMIKSHDVIVAGWGNHGGFMGRDRTVGRMCHEWKCFGMNKGGQPAHPLYMNSYVQLVWWPWTPDSTEGGSDE